MQTHAYTFLLTYLLRCGIDSFICSLAAEKKYSILTFLLVKRKRIENLEEVKCTMCVVVITTEAFNYHHERSASATKENIKLDFMTSI